LADVWTLFFMRNKIAHGLTRIGRSAAAFLFLLGLGAGLRAENEPRWPFWVTPDLQPKILIRLLQFPPPSFATMLFLKHELVNEGCRYVSRIEIPALTSHLVWSGSDQLVWRNFDGSDVVFDRAEIGKETGRGWNIEQLDENGFRIVSSDGNISYDYVACVPVFATVLDSLFKFNYEDGRIVSIHQVSPKEVEILAVDFNQDRTPREIRIGARRLKLSYNDERQLTRCEDARNPGGGADFTYRDGLLASYAHGNEERGFVWGEATWTEYFNTAWERPPVVISDGDYEYRTEENKEGRTTEYSHLRDDQKGRWIFDLRTRKIHFAGGDQRSPKS
jgi:hypothetical protein